MLQFNEIKLEDFGPYKGRQSIEFPDQDGVTIVFGENMRGKTTLLNAIRYALFGKILGRGSREISPERFINWESKAEGKYSFNVTLYFEESGSEYELVRQFVPKDSVAIPEEDDDYTEEVYLIKDDSVTGPKERENELKRILPQQVARFFLFDGELLQQYEELLIDESEMGQRIREAIERILGVPVLKNGRADLRSLLDEAQGQEQKAAQMSNQTNELGTQLEGATEKRNYLQSEFSELRQELSDLQEQKSAKRNQLQQLEAARSLVERREDLEGQLSNVEDGLEYKRDKLRDLMQESWRSVIQDTLQERLDVFEERRRELDKKRTRISVAKRLASRISDGLEKNECPICEQHLDEEAEDHLEQELRSFQGLTEEDTDPVDDYDVILQSINVLQSLAESNPAERIKSTLSEINELKAQRAVVNDEIGEIENSLESSKEERVTQLNTEYENIIGKISEKERTIEDTESELDKTKEVIQKLQSQLDQISGNQLEEERNRRELYDNLVELFDRGVGEYRDRLRQRVEQDASDIFIQLTTEPEYKHLKINENYGLTIIHEDGSEIRVRSAGAEHVVALALMGALQNNAPLKGPIIMDSPFGRLDESHVRNVVEALPRLADQVMLLVYRDEIDPETARELLKGKLRREYTLDRVTARHTNLKEGGMIQ
jgi:DNA sulfur modification protein DndD